MFVTPYKFSIIEGALKIGIQLPLFFLEISMEQTKICFHQINQIFQKTYVRHSPIMENKKRHFDYGVNNGDFSIS